MSKVVAHGDVPARTALSKRRILIVDAFKQKFAEVITALQEVDIETFIEDDRARVVKTAMVFQPDLVLINLFLNSGSTLSIIRELKGALERQGTKILVLTSHQSKENIMESIKSGASDFILEPFDSRQLLQRIKYQLQDREAYSPDELKAEPTQVLAGFQLVYDCLRILAELRETGRAIHECLKRVGDMARSTRVNLILADIELNTARVISSSDDPTLENLQVDLEKYPEVREVTLKGCIVYVKDITTNPLTKDISNQVKTIEIASLLVFPIRHRQETLGTMSVRLGRDGLDVSDKHLKTFYMIALAIAPKVAAVRMMRAMKPAAPKT